MPDTLFTTDDMRAVFADRAGLARMLDFEAALARAEAAVGVIPSSAADAIARHCRVDAFDLDALRNAARDAGKVILDGVYNDVKNAEGFEAECLQGRQFGFDGKTLIHPSQLEPANRLFAPSPSEVEHAQAVIAAFDEATTQGKGVATVNGKLIENLHVADAHRILAVAKAAGLSA